MCLFANDEEEEEDDDDDDDERSSSYRAVNTLQLGYKQAVVNAA
jgi:hypothetical protein